MERRDFIKSSCNACLLLAAGYFLPELSGCSPVKFTTLNTDIINHQITIPVSSFAATNLQLVRPKGWYYNIAVQKKDNGNYSALLLQCTHQENQLTPNGNGFHCSLHGSDFDKDGNVRKGPAEHHLEEYKTFTDNNNLIIEILKTP